MNREQIIQMAREAGFQDGIVDFIGLPVFERFAELVRKDYSTTHANIWLDRIHKFMLEEREACAEIADRLPRIYRETEQAHYKLSPEPFKPSQFGFDFAELRQAEKITHAIRARGQA